MKLGVLNFRLQCRSFSNKGQGSLSEIVGLVHLNAALCRKHVQHVLKLTNVDLGSYNVMEIPSLFLTFIPRLPCGYTGKVRGTIPTPVLVC